MSRSSVFLVLLVMLAGGGVALFESHALTRERQLAVAEQKRVARLEQQLAYLRQQRGDALHSLTLATEQLAASPAGAAVDPARAAEISSWLARVKRLKQAFDERPGQRIPEIQLLTELDWLALARQLRGDSEEDMRKALAKVRDVAFDKFQGPLAHALREYTAAANGVPLSDLSALLPYFKPPIDAAILARYEIVDPMDPHAPPDRHTITERAPVDEEFDNRHMVGNTGANGSGSGPWATDSLSKAAFSAVSEYAAANNGERPKNDAEILPYVHDPTAKVIFEAMVAYENDHHGQQSNDGAELRPYISDPAAKVLLEKLISSKRNLDAP